MHLTYFLPARLPMLSPAADPAEPRPPRHTDIYSSGMATKTQRLLDVIMVTSTQRQIITSFDIDL